MVKITLYYDLGADDLQYGGCYFDWVSVLAMIPSTLLDHPWRIYQGSTGTIMFVIS